MPDLGAPGRVPDEGIVRRNSVRGPQLVEHVDAQDRAEQCGRVLAVPVWVAGAAAVTATRAMVVTAAIASLVWGIPHLVYHIANAGDLDAGDAAASIAGLAIFAVLPVVLIVVSGNLEDEEPGTADRTRSGEPDPDG